MSENVHKLDKKVETLAANVSTEFDKMDKKVETLAADGIRV